MNASLWFFVLIWVVLCGAGSYVLGLRKGYAPLGALGIGAVFGIFGIFYLTLLSGRALRPPRVDAFQQPIAPVAAPTRILIGLLLTEATLVALIGLLVR